MKNQRLVIYICSLSMFVSILSLLVVYFYTQSNRDAISKQIKEANKDEIDYIEEFKRIGAKFKEYENSEQYKKLIQKCEKIKKSEGGMLEDSAYTIQVNSCESVNLIHKGVLMVSADAQALFRELHKAITRTENNFVGYASKVEFFVSWFLIVLSVLTFSIALFSFALVVNNIREIKNDLGDVIEKVGSILEKLD